MITTILVILYNFAILMLLYKIKEGIKELRLSNLNNLYSGIIELECQIARLMDVDKTVINSQLLLDKYKSNYEKELRENAEKEAKKNEKFFASIGLVIGLFILFSIFLIFKN